MEIQNKLRIQGNLKDIVKNIAVSDVQDHLIQCGLLTDEEQEEVTMAGITRQAGVRRLLKILVKKPNSFDNFLDSLEEAHDWLAEQIRNTDPSIVTPPDEADGNQDEKVNQLSSQLWMQTQLMQQFKEDYDNLKRVVEVQADQYKVMKSEFDKAMQSKGIKQQVQVDHYLEDYVQKRDHPNRRALECPDGSSVDTQPALRRCSMGDPSYLTDAIARHLAVDVVRFMALGAKRSPPASDKYAKVMREMVTEMTERYTDSFGSLLDKLEINEMNGYDTLTAVADQLFDDSKTNWGRIVALYGFGGYLAKSTSEPNDSYSSMIGDFLGFYVTTKLACWIEEKGGWEAFIEYFNQKNKDNSDASQFWKNVLLSVVGIAGVATTIGVAVRRS